MNQELRAELSFAIEYFEQGNFFEKQIDEQKQKARLAKEQFRKDEKKGLIFFDLLHLLAVCILVVAGLVVLATVIMIFGDEGFGKTDQFILKMLPLGIILPIGLLVYLKFHDKARNKKFKKIYESQVQPIIDATEAEIEHIKNQASDYIKENSHRINFIPARYQNLSAVSFFYNAISERLADELKEAFRLYEEYLHRCRLEDAAEEAIAEQRLAMNELIRQREETNQRLREIQDMQYWDYMQRKNNK